MGVRAPQKLALAHSRNDKIADVFGPARDLIDAIDALDRVADNRKLALFLSHDVRPSCGRKISVYESSKQLHTLRITAISLLSSLCFSSVVFPLLFFLLSGWGIGAKM